MLPWLRDVTGSPLNDKVDMFCSIYEYTGKTAEHMIVSAGLCLTSHLTFIAHPYFSTSPSFHPIFTSYLDLSHLHHSPHLLLFLTWPSPLTSPSPLSLTALEVVHWSIFGSGSRIDFVLSTVYQQATSCSSCQLMIVNSFKHLIEQTDAKMLFGLDVHCSIAHSVWVWQCTRSFPQDCINKLMRTWSDWGLVQAEIHNGDHPLLGIMYEEWKY